MLQLIWFGLLLSMLLAGCSGPVNQGPAAATPQASTPTLAPTSAGLATTAPLGPSATPAVRVYTLDAEKSTVTYEVGETFLNDDNRFSVAVGSTSGVTGSVSVNFEQPARTTISPLTIDVSRLASDSPRRDNALRERFLQSDQFPTVTFVTTSIEGLPEQIEPGVDYNLRLLGDLTIRDVTRPEVFDATVRLEGDRLLATAETEFLMSEYGIGPIELLGMLRTEDVVQITIEIVGQ